MGLTIQQGLNATNRVASTTDNTLPRFDGTTGAIQTSGIVVDDSNNVSGVGTIASGAVTVTGTAQVPLLATYTDNGVFSGPLVRLTRESTPAANDLMGGFQFQARDSGNNLTVYADVISQILDPTDTSEDGAYQFRTMLAGTLASRMNIAGGIYHASATGGDKGNNTINFGAVYDDNTLLTCYPFDAYLDGAIDDAKWDAKVPDLSIPATYELREVDTGKNGKDGKPVIRAEQVELEAARIEPRRHEDMRKFKARLGTDTDPLDLDKYIKHWREKRHLTSLPNEENFDPVQGLPAGAWIQRLVETVEIQAIHISQLHDRLKVLEGGR